MSLDQQKWLGVALMVVAAMLAMVATSPTSLGLPTAASAWCAVLNAGLAVALRYLPRPAEGEGS